MPLARAAPRPSCADYLYSSFSRLSGLNRGVPGHLEIGANVKESGMRRIKRRLGPGSARLGGVRPRPRFAWRASPIRGVETGLGESVSVALASAGFRRNALGDEGSATVEENAKPVLERFSFGSLIAKEKGDWLPARWTLVSGRQ